MKFLFSVMVVMFSFSGAAFAADTQSEKLKAFLLTQIKNTQVECRLTTPARGQPPSNDQYKKDFIAYLKSRNSIASAIEGTFTPSISVKEDFLFPDSVAQGNLIFVASTRSRVYDKVFFSLMSYGRSPRSTSVKLQYVNAGECTFFSSTRAPLK